MPLEPSKKIAYLFGAGATHAEIMDSKDAQSENFIKKNGLLISHVSQRVMEKAQKNKWFKEHKEVFANKGEFNIELFISLLEANKIDESKIMYLKELIQEDIKTILSKERKSKFYLHNALFELHNHDKLNKKEELIGIISLNYDDILDEAYKRVLDKKPDYCLTSENNKCIPKCIPLLKLHGSFNWQNIEIYGRKTNISIVPIGVNKNYLMPPYNFIWGRTYELLLGCDILRIIGCSMSQNDIGLIDLLFKAHKTRNKPIEIQIIDFQPNNGRHHIKNDYGFLPKIIEPEKIEDGLIADDLIYKETGNPLKIWLHAKTFKILNMNNTEIEKTTYLKKLF
jgi:hypothetical protein